MKKAVILFNMGGPDSIKAVKPFLFNLFQDHHMVPFGMFQRIFSTFISTLRYKKVQKLYQQIGGGKSPLLENTRKQAKALKDVLGEGYEVFVSMRYWHPFSSEVIKDVMKYSPDETILLPLYPQYSTTTTLSSFEDWKLGCKEKGFDVPQKMICCYPENKGFINAIVENLNEALNSWGGGRPCVFSLQPMGFPKKLLMRETPTLIKSIKQRNRF